MSLYRTELRRLGKRRLTRWMTLLGVLVIGAVIVGTFFTNQKIGPEQRAAAVAEAEQQYQEQVTQAEQERAACVQAKASGQETPEGRYPEDCAAIEAPPRGSIQPEWFLPSTFDFRKGFEETIVTFTAIVALLGFLVGGSFVGAEWSSGGMMNLLLWRPRRLTVLLTKLGALLTGTVAVTVAAATVWTAGYWLVGTLRGSTATMTSGAWQSFALTGLRGLVLIVVAVTLGFALASLGRHTAMALGAAIGVAVVGQFGLGIVMAMAGVRFLEAWLLPTYALAWMQKKVTLEDWQSCNVTYYGECKPDTLDVTWGQSSILFAAALVVVLGAALVAMRRRDVA
ncbi:ABC transporter permease subunit [Micromonospora okii]|uniref:ABC transporter permease subunit n=1 Tax=Micromonospora okii TaxID=1182970 RepID=UPI001E51C4A0|nr:ABC transporter permease subunit [Micromonospora okii]